MNEKKNTKTLSTELKKFLLFALLLFCLHSLLFSWGDSEDSTRSIGEVEGVKRKAVTKQDSKSAESMQQLVEKKGLLIPREPDTIPANTISRIIKDTPDHYLSSCIPTSQFLIVPQEADGTLLLHSLDPSGRRKYKGGDEIYVTYRDQNNDSISPTAIARIEDLQNGSYKLDFVKSRSPKIDHSQKLAGIGSVTIYLHYTCFAGHLDPPSKNTWNASGALNTKYTSINTLVAPPMRDVEMPKQLPELASYDNIYTVGNSLMGQQFYKKYDTRNEYPASRMPNFHVMGTFGSPLNTESVKKLVSSEFVDRFHARHEVDMNANNAIMVGSCVWDMMARDSKESNADPIQKDRKKGRWFEWNVHLETIRKKGRWFEWNDHLEAIEIWITSLRNKYPGWKIYWKGCTSIQIHAWKDQDFSMSGKSIVGVKSVGSVFYTSYIRSQQLDKLQKELLQKMEVPVMDLWDLSFDMAEFHRKGDTRHYENTFYDFSNDHIFGNNL